MTGRTLLEKLPYMADVLVSLSQSLAGCEFLIVALSRESYRALQDVLQGDSDEQTVTV